jgi:tRNA(Ile)-lysidine synthetase-like protein
MDAPAKTPYPEPDFPTPALVWPELSQGVVLVAVSGGADSMALWDLVARAGLRHAVVHVDHGLRPTSHRDARVISAHVARLRQEGIAPIAVRYERVEVRPQGDGLEAAARRARYGALLAAARDLGAAQVITAHHRDDQAETLLLALLRGAKGLRPMPVQRQLAEGVRLVRPVLSLPGAVLRQWCQRRGIAWVEDETNTDTLFQRNAVRHRVLPTFEAGCPGFSDALIATARSHAPSPHAIRDWLIAQRLPVDRHLLRRVEDLLAHPLQREVSVQGWTITAEPTPSGPILRARRSRSLPETTPTPVPLGPAEVPVAGGTLHLAALSQVTVAEVRAPTWSSRNPCAPRAILAISALVPPLVWRAPEHAERWQPLGCSGQQTIHHARQSRRTPLDQRDLPLLADALGVVWVPDVGIADRVRLVEGAPALAVALTPWAAESKGI